VLADDDSANAVLALGGHGLRVEEEPDLEREVRDLAERDGRETLIARTVPSRRH